MEVLTCALVRNVLVVGAGIAGSAAAIVLARRGDRVRLVELQREVEGASVAITQRAVYALRELGVLEDCLACGLVFRGRPLLRGDTRLPQAIMMHRPELVRILREMAEQHGAVIEVGVRVAELQEQASHVAVVFEDGRREAFELVIGADGTQSHVRAWMRPDVSPSYAGQMSFRWLADIGMSPPVGYHSAGQGVVVVIGRLPDRVAYVAVGVDMEQRHVDSVEARSFVRSALETLDAQEFVQLRAALDTQQKVLVWPIEWLFVPPPWHRGRTVLIGDAVHATTPHLSAGTGMALEDACVLGQELARTNELDGALAAFARRRAPRTKLIVAAGLKLLELQRTAADPQAFADARRAANELLAAPY